MPDTVGRRVSRSFVSSLQAEPYCEKKAIQVRLVHKRNKQINSISTAMVRRMNLVIPSKLCSIMESSSIINAQSILKTIDPQRYLTIELFMSLSI